MKKLKKKNVIISIDAEKLLTLFNNLFMIKISENWESKDNTIKDIQKKPVANITLNGERLNAFLISGTQDTWSLFLLLLFKIILAV